MWLETEPARPSQAALLPAAGAPWLTLEVALYACLLVAAALLRLTGLGDAVLSPGEAGRALAAWNVGHGKAVDLSGGPTLIYGTGILFFLVGANDAVARALPAFAGLWLVAWPFFMRRELGRKEAFFTSLLLSLSPSLVWASRLVAGETIVLGLAALAVLGWLRYREHGGKVALTVAGGAAGLALAAGPAAIAVLVPLASVGGLVAVARPGERNGAVVPGKAWRWLLASGAVVLAAVCTGLGSNPGGVQRGLVDAAAAALGGAAGAPVTERAFFVGGVVTYELAALAFALLSLIICRRRGALARITLAAAVAAMGLYSLLPAGGTERLALVAAPLAVAGGQSLGCLWSLARGELTAKEAGLFVGLTWPVLGLWGTVAGSLALPVSALNPWFLLAPVLLLGLVTSLWAYWRGAGAAAYGLAALVTLVLLVGEVRTGANLAFNTGRSPSEPIAATGISGDLRNLLVEVNAHAAVLATPGRRDLAVAVSQSVEQPLAWYLRDFSRATYGDLKDAPRLVVTAAGETPPPGDYRYKKYVWRLTTNQPPATVAQFWRWLVYREFPGAQTAQQAILYVAVQKPS
ncbi:MAG: hypothetical protein ACYC3S_13620 [Chloroflexota bacterium]